ncbi:metal-sensing transcriptional repressor [Tissierella sp. Yu-01]|uniref:metal-sensing transcriptional repressor n=1 Tax=Tissierella sp. Yu-01 TaxID=3035694 RepID=UPI00240DC14D|nr:metal-sensing transcriptional repressor [Tissierella sp. Yu-01]WFA08849.1 metal-sensing transcriptional repressor [Tissierella sp. Yu-01]
MNEKSIILLKLAKGELDAIKYMIEEGWDCIDISNRILETQYLLNKANNLITKQHLFNCSYNETENENKNRKNLM